MPHPLQLPIALSLALNAALAAACLFRSPGDNSLAAVGIRPPPPPAAADAASSSAAVSPSTTSTPSSRWSALHTDDLPGLIIRLQAAGFPPFIIRAIVIAEVDARAEQRLHALHGTDEMRPFWKSDPSPFGHDPKQSAEHSRIYRERSRLLRELLGESFPEYPDPSAEQRRRYGDLPPGKIAALQQIEADYSEMSAQLRAAADGIRLAEDREKHALLEREKQADLAALLSPAELESYQMRNAHTTRRLSRAMALMDATEAEFRAVYRVRKAFDDRLTTQRISEQVAAGSYSGDPAAPAIQQLAADLRAALGDARYADYERAGNYEYQNLTYIAQRENVPLEAAHRAFSVRDHVARESTRIHGDATLAADEKRAALKALAQDTRTQLLATLGPSAGPAYLRHARWLSLVESGNAVAFGPENTMSVRRVPGAPAR